MSLHTLRTYPLEFALGILGQPYLSSSNSYI